MIPDEADALYAERPDAFVAARNALVKALRKEGRRDEATAVAELRRPSPASWSLNQVARRDHEAVAALLDAGAALQAETARAVSGKRGDLRQAQETQRRALDALLDAAMARGRELGVGNLDQLRRRASNTLHAAIADEEVASRLREGRLDEDLDAPGFGFGFGAVPDTGDEPAETAAEPSAQETREEAVEDEAAALEAERAQIEVAAQRAALEKRIARLERDAARLEQAADRAERAARDARDRADAAAQALADAQSELADLDS